MIQHAPYRPFRFAVAVALLFSMAMPLVTYACDLTGLIETPLAMADHADDADSSDSDCPCEGPMQDMCGPRALDCAVVINCQGESFDADACCSSQPALKDAVVPGWNNLVELQPALVGVVVDQPVQVSDASPIDAAILERPPPVEAPIHILNSSLLL